MAAAGNTFFFAWEAALEVWLQSRLPAAVLSLISFFSAFGEEGAAIMILGIFYWCLDKETGRYIGINVIMGCVWHPMIKNIALRRRPYFDHEGIDLLRPLDPGADLYDIQAQGYSFPSGHSTNGPAVYGSLARRLKKRRMSLLAVLVTFLIGFSRVAVGAHYPTDVLAGWGLGLAIIFLVPYLREKTGDIRIFYGILIASGLPGFFFARTDDYYTGMGLLLGFALAEMFERKYVNFKKAETVSGGLLRILGGLILYAGLNFLLKSLFNPALTPWPGPAEYLFRTLRYTLILFALLGLYPMCFEKLTKRDTD
ncbi:MAG: phosphatase PAP2 family protein [Lachnospiraceae bacterium]|nr:phosphatase PAP2 family protein [Lachnospiraceae bacterium]